MKNKNAAPQPPTEVLLKDASSLWKYLVSGAGLDLKHYDPEILSGNEIHKGLYGHLGISANQGNFVVALQDNMISVEALVQAFFKTWQPYAQMMRDICLFFQRHSVAQTDRSLKIVFDFSQLNENELEFDLKHFKLTIEAIEKIQRIAEWSSFQKGDHYPFIRTFCKGYLGKSKRKEVSVWSERFNSRKIVDIDEFSWPVTPIEEMNRELRRLELIWRVVMRKIIEFDMFEDRHKLYEFPGDTLTFQNRTNSDKESLSIVAGLVGDRWPATFVNSIFKLLEDIEELPVHDRESQYRTLASNLKLYLDEHTVSTEEVQNLIDDLVDLLQLPIWRRRHELYGTWILALCDQTLKEYPNYVLHHEKGTLRLPFKKTRLITFSTELGNIDVYSESQNTIVEPEGESRTNHIQPDYTFYRGGGSGELDAVAVIEVKQYRVPKISNFQHALNDYAKALPSATIFLTNYGVAPKYIGLNYPNRCHFFGQVMPESHGAGDFAAALLASLPKNPLVRPRLGSMELARPHEELLASVKRIYVDISASLDVDDYKVFVRELLTWLLPTGQVEELVAVDEGIRFSWNMPQLASINELLEMKFDKSTDFDKHIMKAAHSLVITDKDGSKGIKDNDLLFIEFSPDDQVLYRGNRSIR